MVNNVCRIVLKITLNIGLLMVLTNHASAQEPTEKSLYERLGGYNAIAAVVDDFIGRLVTDSQLSRFFVGHGKDSKQGMRQLIVDQLCEAFGGPCIYKGRDMRTTHDGLGLSNSDWEKSVEHLVATLDKFKVPKKEKDEVLAAASGLKSQIVQSEIDLK